MPRRMDLAHAASKGGHPAALAALFLPCITAVVGFAQAPAQPPNSRPAFDVASVKINASGDRRGSVDFQSPDRFAATNQVLPSLISFAYKVPPGKLSGGPAWLRSERFDIAARAAGPVSTDQKMLMLRSLLEDRFRLKIRIDTTQGPIYGLIMARSDRRLGPNMRPTSAECVASIEARMRLEVPAPAGQPGPCGPPTPAGPGNFKLTGVQMASLAVTLGAQMQQTVVDRTGLAGWFDVELRSSMAGLIPAGRGGGGTPPDRSVEPLPSIFTAIQEQLGLKLDPQRGPIETFVVESVELPTPD